MLLPATSLLPMHFVSSIKALYISTHYLNLKCRFPGEAGGDEVASRCLVHSQQCFLSSGFGDQLLQFFALLFEICPLLVPEFWARVHRLKTYKVILQKTCVVVEFRFSSLPMFMCLSGSRTSFETREVHGIKDAERL